MFIDAVTRRPALRQEGHVSGGQDVGSRLASINMALLTEGGARLVTAAINMALLTEGGSVSSRQL